MAEEGLQLFGGDWTERKLDALSRYLKAYATALSKTRFRRIYIDAFAGTGYREQKLKPAASTPSIFDKEVLEITSPEPQRFLDGSAKIALRIDPPFHQFVLVEQDDQFVLVEQDDEKVAELEKLKAEFAQQAGAIVVRAGDANATIQNLCRDWDKAGTRGVLFLDPFGMQADWSTVQAVADTGCIDTWILFPFAANRLMTRDPKDIPAGWRTRLDKLFGTKDWEMQFYRECAIPDVFDGDRIVVEKMLTLEGLGAFYHQRLKSIFPVVAPNPRMLRTSSNRPLFQLFFAASNAGRGGEIALKIAKHILDKI